RLPPFSAHPGCITTESGDPQTAEAILARLTRKAAAKLDRVPVGDAALLEHGLQRRLVELGIVTRAGEASHVDDRADTGLVDNRHELVRRPCPMSNRPDDHDAPRPRCRLCDGVIWSGARLR